MKTTHPMFRLALSGLLGLSLVAASLALNGCASTPERKSTGEVLDDATITGKVKTSLVRDPVVKAIQINVDTYKGVVSLSGFVDNEEQIRRAGELAGQVIGVREVRNNLSVKPRTTR